MWQWFRRFARWIHQDPIYGPLTEGKTRGNTRKPNIKVPAQRPKNGPPAPTPKPRSGRCAPNHAIECDWIEIYIAHGVGGHEGCYKIEHYDKARFWQDSNGNLVIFKGFLENTVTYHDYVKYVTHNAKHCGGKNGKSE